MFARALQDTEKAKVLQSIASVIQALPPAEEIPPVEVGFPVWHHNPMY